MPVPAAAFREWAGSDGFTAPLERRLRALGIADGARAARAPRSRDPGWRPIAALDRAVRAVEELATAGAVARGRRGAPAGRGAGRGRGRSAAARAAARGSAHATAPPAPPADDGSEQVTVRGAVLLRASGAAPLDEARRARPAGGAAGGGRRAARARRRAALWRLLREGRVRWRALAAGVALAALGPSSRRCCSAALFDRAAGGAVRRSSSVLLAVLLALELPLAWRFAARGRRARRAVPRPASCARSRASAIATFKAGPSRTWPSARTCVHKLRALPTLAGDIVRTALEIVVVAAALVWLDPRGAALAIALAAAMLLIPLLAQPAVAERDLRMRNHAGALGRFYLDALLGLVTIRTHGAEPALAARARGSAARVGARRAGALRAALARRGGCRRWSASASARWLLAALLRAAAARATRARRCWPSTGRCRCRCSGTSWRCCVQQVPAQRNLTLRLRRAARRARGERGRRRAR